MHWWRDVFVVNITSEKFSINLIESRTAIDNFTVLVTGSGFSKLLRTYISAGQTNLNSVIFMMIGSIKDIPKRFLTAIFQACVIFSGSTGIFFLD